MVIELGQTVYGCGVGSHLEAPVILPKLEHLGTRGFTDVQIRKRMYHIETIIPCTRRRDDTQRKQQELCQ